MSRNSRPSTVAWFAFLVGGLCVAGIAKAQTATDPQVWSCLTNCSATSNTYSDGAWRLASTRPAYVAATTGTNTNCATNWWNTSGAIRWRRIQDVQPTHCVAARRTASEDVFLSASVLWPATQPPVDCAVSPWSDWVAGEWGQCANGTRSRTETRTRTVTTQPANGGAACPALTETRTVSEPCTPPAPLVYLQVSPLWIYTGENLNLEWRTENVTGCVTTGFTTTTPQGGTAVVGPNITPLVLEFSLTCQTGNPVSPTFGVTVHAEVRPKTPKVLPHLADFIAPPGGLARVQWEFLETTGTPYTFKTTYFWRDELGVVHQETWAVSANPLRYAVREQNGGRYDETEARGECEQNCNARLPDGPLKDELDAWGRQWTVEQLGIVE